MPIKDIQELNLPEYATLSDATFSAVDMGDRTISTQLQIDGDITPDFSFNWELLYRGEKYIYKFREPQSSKDTSSQKAKCDLLFRHWAIDKLTTEYYVKLQGEGANTVIDQYVKPINYDLKGFCDEFNRVLAYYWNDSIQIDLNPNWEYSTEKKLVSISYTKCWDLLQQMYQLFEVRWMFKAVQDGSEEALRNEKYVIKVGYPAPEIDKIFEYGKSANGEYGGLVKFERQQQDNNIANKLIGRGGQKNLPIYYFKTANEGSVWASDPDAIPETENLEYYGNLRGQTYRDYVRGFGVRRYGKTAPPVSEQRWAYTKGYEDGATGGVFRPIEFVKDDESIAKFGEIIDGLDNNDSIFPTIQDIEVNPYGRIDECVYVEQIVIDNPEETTTSESISSNLPSFSSPTTKFNFGETKIINFKGQPFDIKSDIAPATLTCIYNISGLNTRSSSRYVPPIPGEVKDGTPLLVIQEDINKIIKIKRLSDGLEVSQNNLPQGSYYVEFSATIQNNNTTATKFDFTSVTVNISSIKLISKNKDESKWKPTFNIWVKNIWGSTKSESESDVQYVSRVWDKILGDKEGKAAAVMFSDGNLAHEDYEFSIVKDGITYDTSKSLNGVNSEWLLTLAKSDAEEKALGNKIPYTKKQGNAGDHFFFIGIDMPHQYVLWAEDKLDEYKEDALLHTAKNNPTFVLDFDHVQWDKWTDKGYEEFIGDIHEGYRIRATDKRFITDEAYKQLYVQSKEVKWENGKLLKRPSIVVTDKVMPVINPLNQIQGEVDSLRSQLVGLSTIEQFIRLVGDKIYLRKDGVADRSISPTEFSSLVTDTTFRQGAIGGKGWGIYKDNNGNSILELDKLVLRQDLEVNNLVVNQITVVGGKQILSAANTTITRVDETSDGYMCYFDQRQGTIANMFIVDDIVLCQVFSPENTEIKFYKRKVVDVSENTITLSKKIVNGDGVPEIGDVIVQYGNYTDTSRRYVIIRDVIGGGYERMLSGLYSVDSDGDEYYFAGKMYNQNPRFKIGFDDQYIQWINGKLYIKGALITLGSGVDIPINDFIENTENRISYLENGLNVYVLDLDTEFTYFFADKDGNIPSGLPYKNAAHFYYGNEEITNDVTWTVINTGCVATINIHTGEILLKSVNSDEASVLVATEIGGVSHYYTWQIVRFRMPSDEIVPDRVQLLPSTNIIKKDKNGLYNPSSISCGISVQNGNGISNPSTLPTGYTISILIDDIIGSYNINNSIPSNYILNYLEFILKYNNIILDKKRIPVISDGQDGLNAQYIEISGVQSLNNPSYGTTINLTASKFGFNNSVQWQYMNNIGNWTNLGTSDTQVITYNINQFIDNIARIKCYSINNENIFDTYTVAALFDGENGEDGYSFILTNENISVPYDSTGTIPSVPLDAIYTEIIAYKGSTRRNIYILEANGLLISNNNTLLPKLTVQKLDSDFNNFNIKINVDGIIYDKLFCVNKAKEGKPGPNGENAIIIDLTNQISTVNVNIYGNVVGKLQGTQAIVYKGGKIDTGWSFSKIDDGAISTIDSNTGILTISSISKDVSIVTITASKSGYDDLKATYTITKVYPGNDGEDAVSYWIMASVNVIHRDNLGVSNPSTIFCDKFKQVGSGQPVLTTDYYLYYQLSNGPITKYSNIINVDNSDWIYFIFSTSSEISGISNSNILDRERIPVISDGQDGLNNTNIKIYRRFSSATKIPVPPSNSTYNFTTGIVSNLGVWSQEIPKFDIYNIYLWEARAYVKSYNDIENIIWDTPVLSKNDVQSYEYLKDAIKNGTQITVGGLVLSNLFATTPSGQESNIHRIQSFQSGIENDGVSFGSDDTDAYNKSIEFINGNQSMRPKFLVTKTGRLYASEVNLIGNIYALSGSIANFDVLGNSISGSDTSGKERIKFSLDKISPLSSLSDSWVNISYGYSDSFTVEFYREQSDNGQERSKTSDYFYNNMAIPFTLPISSDISFETELFASNSSDAYITISYMIRNSSGIKVWSGSASAVEEQMPVIKTINTPVLPSGTYTISSNVSIGTYRSGFFIETYRFNYRFFGITIRTGEEKTKIGINGLYSYFNNNNYVYYNSEYGFEFKYGNGGIRSTGSGLQKWNGLTWTAL